MATITFKLSNKIDELGISELHIRFCASREQIYRTKSGLFVPVSRWSKKNEVSIPKLETNERKQLLLLDSKLKELKKHILTSFEDSDKTQVDKDWLIRCVDRFHYPEKYIEKTKSFFDLFDEFLAKRKLSEGRLKSIQVVYRSLKRYELFKQKTDDNFKLELKKFNEAALGDFENFLISEQEIYDEFPDICMKVEKSRKPKQRSLNTLNDIFVKLKTFLTWCVDEGEISSNPLKKYKVDSAVFGTPYYITIAERNKIYKHNFSKHPRLEIQRDIFIFQCLVGCRVGDLYQLKRSNVINGAIEYIARKTKDGHPVTVRVPLNSIAVELIRKYEGDNSERLFPFIPEQKYNYAIKEVFRHAGITRNVTILNPRTRLQEQVPINQVASSHLARRTFIGNLYKKVKDPNLVGSLSGHKENSQAFARYRDIDDEIKTDLVNLLL